MNELEARALRKRVVLPNHFSHPVIIEAASVHDTLVLAQVRRPDGGLEDVTLEIGELEEALRKAGSATAELLPGRDVFHVLESARIRLAFHYDPYFAVSLSGVRALPHQLEAVYERLLPQPRLRFVLAHDPGAGKTIMAGLLIKELKLRGAADRILVIVPAALTPQWQDELSEKFQETFEIIDSHSETSQVAGNLWQRLPQVITSMDYAKRDGSDNPDGPYRSVRDSILQCSWDLVVVDEAHKASASKFGDEIKATKRYRLVEELSRSAQVHNLLLLTATPHQGRPDQFQLFLRLLDPDQFDDKGLDYDELRKLLAEERCPFFLRRVKEELRDFDGRKLFLPRHAYTVDFELSGPEKALYDDVTRYIREFLGKTYSGRRRMAVALARSVLQRRMASSLHAITESLRRRMERLAEFLEDLDRWPEEERKKKLAELGMIQLDEEVEYDDQDDEDKDRASTEVFVADTIEGLRREVAELRRLHAKAIALRDAMPSVEEKLRKLETSLDRAEFAALREQNGKLLIFTEHRDTLAHLERNLKAWGYSVVTIHGGHSALERKERRQRFENDCQVCIATDAAGEGVNLQFCHLMINYDVPWNPNRLEQRMGRIHRIGQDREVHVFNFVAINTEEGRVLHRLFAKINQIKEDLQTDRIFDVIGAFLRVEGLNIEDVLREAAVNPKRAEDFLHDVEKLSAERLRQFEKATAVALAKKQLDLAALNHRTQLHEDLRLMPEYVQEFFLAAAAATALTIEERADGLLRVPSVPQRFRAPALRAVQRYGPAQDRYLKATFRKEQRVGRNGDAALLSPGHPLYLATVELFEAKLGAREGGTAVFRDPRAREPYLLHVFEVGVVGEAAGLDVRSIRREIVDARFVPVMEMLDDPDRYELAAQDLLHDLEPLSLSEITPDLTASCERQVALTPIDPGRARKAANWVRLNVQFPMVKDHQETRRADAEIRRRYLEQAFEARLHRLRQQELEMLARQDRGEQGAAGRVALIRDELQQTELRRDERLKAVERLAVARGGDVRHLASVIVLPLPETTEAHALMHSDPEVERVAMECVIQHERDRAWIPEDVSTLKDGRGYDVLSTGPEDQTGLRPVRRIEVKGRAGVAGDVALTRNEWIKAARLRQQYWLYVVYEARPGAIPRLVKVQDPATALGSVRQPLIEVRGYRLPGAAVVKHASEG